MITGSPRESKLAVFSKDKALDGVTKKITITSEYANNSATSETELNVKFRIATTEEIKHCNTAPQFIVNELDSPESVRASQNWSYTLPASFDSERHNFSMTLITPN